MGNKKYWSIITLSLISFVSFLFFSQILSADTITPGSISATLHEGECITETKTVTLQGVPANVDIMFSFDLTGSMGGIINTAKSKANEIMAAVQAALPGSAVRFGVASYMDYPASYSSCGYGATYGSPAYGDYAYRRDCSLTSNISLVSSAIAGLTLGNGMDGPQDYTRVFYESYADSGIGWSEGVRIWINFGDNVPHDCNLNEGLGGSTWSTGGDPGRDGVMGTGDDLDLQAVLSQMSAHHIILMELHTTSSYNTHWNYWTGITGGSTFITSSDPTALVNNIVAAVNSAIRHINTLTLSASAGYGGWLVSVSPASYINIDIPEGGTSRNFGIQICVPVSAVCGIHNFTINAVGDGAVLAKQYVTIEVPCNEPPVAEAGGPYVANEGSPITFNGSGSTDPDGDTLEYCWDFNNDGTWDTSWSTSPTASHTWYDDHSGTARLAVRDAEYTVYDTAVVTVNNVAPSVNAGADQTANEGATVSLAPATFSDPGSGDTHTTTINWGDGTAPDAGIVGAGTVSGSHVYADNGVYTVTVTVVDDDAGTTSDSLIVTVNNVAPTVSVGPDQSGDEGSPISISSSTFNDLGTLDTHTATIDWDDGTIETAAVTESPFGPPGSTSGAHGTVADASHTYGDNGVYTVTVTVTDDDGGVGSAALTITVYNVAPTLSPITVTSLGAIDEDTFAIIVPINIDLTAMADFTDHGWLDTHTATWDWGDSTNLAGTVAETNNPPQATGTVEDVYSYAAPGVYTITLTVTDDDLDTDTSIYTYVVVVDPSDGFVTGGGRIYSPPGAYIPDSSLEGSANFGFVSKYLKKSLFPVGQTEFHFQVADLNFHSSSYQWLVISGPMAKYKGWGTVNGVEGYGFMLTAVDGELKGDDIDRFRMKIWWIDPVTSAETVIYDNELGVPDDQESTTAIEGGSIVIHE